jgi:hypothetical protein
MPMLLMCHRRHRADTKLAAGEEALVRFMMAAGIEACAEAVVLSKSIAVDDVSSVAQLVALSFSGAHIPRKRAKADGRGAAVAAAAAGAGEVNGGDEHHVAEVPLFFVDTVRGSRSRRQWM